MEKKKLNPKLQAAVDVVVDLSKEIERRTSEIAVGKISLGHWSSLTRKYKAACIDLYALYTEMVASVLRESSLPILTCVDFCNTLDWVTSYGAVRFTEAQLKPSYWMKHPEPAPKKPIKAQDVDPWLNTQLGIPVNVAPVDNDAIAKLMLEAKFVETCKSYMKLLKVSYTQKYIDASAVIKNLKLVVSDPRYDSFLSTNPRNIEFVNGYDHLRIFSESSYLPRYEIDL